jgi:hypothetical protein
VTTQELQRVVQEGVEAWRSVPGASVSFQFEGVTRGAVTNDRVATVGFEPLGAGVLGVTRVLINTITGELVDGDIGLTTSASWTPNPPQADRRDLVATTTHELGHMLGLAHSAVGETEDGLRRPPRDRHRDDHVPDLVLGRDRGPPHPAGRRSQPARALPGGLHARLALGTRHARRPRRPGRARRQLRHRIGGAGRGVHAERQRGLHDRRVARGAQGVARRAARRRGLQQLLLSAFLVETGFQVTFHDRLVLVPAGGAAAPVTIEVAAR